MPHRFHVGDHGLARLIRIVLFDRSKDTLVIPQTNLGGVGHAIGAAALFRQRLRDHLQYGNPERILGSLGSSGVKGKVRGLCDAIRFQSSFVVFHSLPHGRKIVVRGFTGGENR